MSASSSSESTRATGAGEARSARRRWRRQVLRAGRAWPRRLVILFLGVSYLPPLHDVIQWAPWRQHMVVYLVATVVVEIGGPYLKPHLLRLGWFFRERGGAIIRWFLKERPRQQPVPAQRSDDGDDDDGLVSDDYESARSERAATGRQGSPQ